MRRFALLFTLPFLVAAAAGCGGDSGEVGDGGGGTPSTFTPTSASESEPNGTIGTSDGPYTADHLISAAIDAAGDFDCYAIRNSTGATASVRIETSEGSVGACELADTVITVVDSGGTQVGYDDDSGVNACSLLTIPIPVGTTFYVFVEDFYGSTIPSYLLQVDFL